MQTLLIINQSQFGYHIDTFYYCKYLKNEYRITYLCWNYNKPEINLEGVEVVCVPRNGGILKNNYNYLKKCLSAIDNYDLVFVNYFRGCSILKIKNKKNLVLDIRTGAVSSNLLKRLLYNGLLIFESSFYKNITIISSSLKNHLKIKKDCHILPLGSDTISTNKKTFLDMNLIYIGTLTGRKIESTILGFEKFYKKYYKERRITYTIIGAGWNKEEEDFQKLIDKIGMNSVVKLKGHIPHDNLKEYFDDCNVGISYIPLTSYYDCQPPTKTFEYILAGMPVIATNTKENRKIINDKNGVLIKDTPDDFARGLEKIYKTLTFFDSDIIRSTCIDSTWEAIITKNLQCYLLKIKQIAHSKLV